MRIVGPTRHGGDDVVDLLLECHARIRSFTDLAVRLASAGGLSDAEIADAAASVHRYFAQALPLHARDEDESVLPRLRGRDPEVDRELAAMSREHVEHQPAVGRLVELCGGLEEKPARFQAAASPLGSVAAELAEHFAIHLEREERVIFPAIRRLLSPEERARIVLELRERRQSR